MTLGMLTVAAALPLLSAVAQTGLLRRRVAAAGRLSRLRRVRDALWRWHALLLALFPLTAAVRLLSPYPPHRTDVTFASGIYLIAILELVDVAVLRAQPGRET